MSDKIAFVPKGPYTTVTTEAQHLDRTVEVTSEKAYQTADPLLISQLDEHPHLRRQTAADVEASTSAAEQDEPAKETAKPKGAK